MRSLSPVSLILICLCCTCLIAGWTLNNLDQMDLVAVFMAREALETSAFTLLGGAWLVLASMVFVIGDAFAQFWSTKLQVRESHIDLDRLGQMVFIVNAGLLSVTLVWLASAAQTIGGFGGFTTLIKTDPLAARALLLDSKLFTGMRLFYAALPATGCAAAALLAKGGLSKTTKRLCLLTLFLNTIALLFLPVVMSQRLLFLQFLLSMFLVVCLTRQQFIKGRWLCAAICLFCASWVLRESITNPSIDRSAVDIGFQKLAFYFVNDLWNGFAPLQAEIPHMYGAVSLKGLMFLTFTQQAFAPFIAARSASLDPVLGGGDFPFFTAALVDFGIWGGCLFIGACAFCFRIIFIKSQHSFIWCCVYAQLGATLLFSTHGIYFTHQNFLFSIGVLWFIHLAANNDLLKRRNSDLRFTHA